MFNRFYTFWNNRSLFGKMLIAALIGLACYLILLFLFLGAVMLVSGNSTDFLLSQPDSNIVSIEIVHFPGSSFYHGEDLDTVIPIAEVPRESHDDLLRQLKTVPYYAYGHDPIQWVVGGGLRITYSDGSYELISHIGGITYDPKHDPAVVHHNTYFDEEVFLSFLSEYGYQKAP